MTGADPFFHFVVQDRAIAGILFGLLISGALATVATLVSSKQEATERTRLLLSIVGAAALLVGIGNLILLMFGANPSEVMRFVVAPWLVPALLASAAASALRWSGASCDGDEKHVRNGAEFVGAAVALVLAVGLHIGTNMAGIEAGWIQAELVLLGAVAPALFLLTALAGLIRARRLLSVPGAGAVAGACVVMTAMVML